MSDAIFRVLLKQLMLSHSKLSQAEYNRDPSYNNEHFSYKAEEGMLNYFKEKYPEFLNDLLRGEPK